MAKCFDNSCWINRTKCEKILICSNIIVAVIIIIIGVTFLIHTQTKEIVCFTPECTLAAARILRTVNWSMSPCDGFYEMVCGIKESKSSTVSKTPEDYFESNIFFNKIMYNALLENGDNDDKYAQLFPLPRKFFQVCMDKEQRTLDQKAPSAKESNQFQKLTQDIFSSFSWPEAIMKAKEAGFPYNQFFTIQLQSNPNDGNKAIFVIGPPYHFDYSLKNNDLNEKSQIVLEIKKLCSYFSFSKEEMDKILPALEFEQKIMQAVNQTGIQSIKPLSPTEIDSNYNLGLDTFWQRIIGEKIKDKIVYVTDENYLKNIKKFVDEQQIDVIKIFMKIQLILYVNMLDEFSLSNLLDVCIKQTYVRFPIITSALYLSRVDKQSKNSVLVYIKTLQSVMDRVIRGITWMDDTTQGKAHKKWMHMKTSLSYNDYLIQEMQDFYSNLTLGQHYLDNVLRININSMNYWKDIFNDGDTFAKKIMTPLYSIESSGYIQELNQFVIGAHYLQDMFFEKTRPEYMNFAAFGTHIATQLAHGYDNIGKFFDFAGQNKLWWNDYTQRQYEQKANCITQQFNKYLDSRSNLTIDGYLTKDKNLADASAIDIAYFGYIGWTRMYGQCDRLPGMNDENRKIENEKLFWISYASSFCTKYQYEPDQHIMQSNLISPKVRVNAALSNSLNFRKDFNCEKDSKMVNPNTCGLLTVDPWFFVD